MTDTAPLARHATASPRANAAWTLVAALAALAALAACGPVAPPADVTAGDAAADAAPAGETPTYWRDVAPVLEAHCVRCHTAGGIGPMPLTTYAEARVVAPLIATETTARRMPPFPADPTGCAPLRDANTLTAAQITALARWAHEGTPEGVRGDYVAPPVDPGDGLPAVPDRVVAMPEPYAPRSGLVDDFRCFVLDAGLAGARDVIGLRVRPGNRRIVHHVVLIEVRDPASIAAVQDLDARDPSPGFECFGGVGVTQHVELAPRGSAEPLVLNMQQVLAWAPGNDQGRLPEGTGIRLSPTGRLVMQIHYNTPPSAAGMTDQTGVELFFSPTAVAHPAYWFPLFQPTFRIPAGAAPSDPRAQVGQTASPDVALRIYGLWPHMHLRGYSVQVGMARRGEAGAQCLVNVPRWNFHWQVSYWLATPLDVRAGGLDTLGVRCVYDNTAANQPVIDGVPLPPREVGSGESSNDEMCGNFFYLTL